VTHVSRIAGLATLSEIEALVHLETLATDPKPRESGSFRRARVYAACVRMSKRGWVSKSQELGYHLTPAGQQVLVALRRVLAPESVVVSSSPESKNDVIAARRLLKVQNTRTK
jgi:DNA-binding PadR family transcriptional regulator